MTDKITTTSIDSTFDVMINKSEDSGYVSDVVADEGVDSDDSSDHSPGLPQEEFCIAIKNAVNGSEIYKLVDDNLLRGKSLFY